MNLLHALLAAVFLLHGCGGDQVEDEVLPRPDIIATNAFYYYADVDTAWNFYVGTLGFETVADYGFAKILRLSENSYLTLVQADEGMHSSDEPKTVTLNLITDTLEPWYSHLSENAVDMRVAHAKDGEQQANYFVAADPEGYFLKFIRYNPHPGHEDFVGAFAALSPVSSSVAQNLTIRASVTSVYFDDIANVSKFYEGLFDVKPSGKMVGVPIYQMSQSGFVALVDGGDELHQPTGENGVTLSFLTTDIDAWFERATGWPGFELRTPKILNEGGLVKVFVGYDPNGIFLEWDTFLDLEENSALMRHLEKNQSRFDAN